MVAVNNNLHLTSDERKIILKGIEFAASEADIARTLGKDKSTTGKEIKKYHGLENINLNHGGKMLDNKGFDAWSKSFDQAVNSSDAADQYPFAGYQAVIDEIFQLVCEKAEAKILDIGFGTATLSSRLYQEGCEIYGQDFSKKC